MTFCLWGRGVELTIDAVTLSPNTAKELRKAFLSLTDRQDLILLPPEEDAANSWWQASTPYRSA